MMALTFDTKRCAAEDSVAYLRSSSCISPAWRICTCESASSSQAWISEAWSLGGGSIVDIHLVDVHRVHGYLSKYLTKDFFGSVPAKMKRIISLRDIHLLEIKSLHSDWRWSPDSIRNHLHRIDWRGLRSVTDVLEDDAGLRSFSGLDSRIQSIAPA